MKTKLLRRLRKNLKIIARETIEDQVPVIHYTLQEYDSEDDDFIDACNYLTSSFDFKYILNEYHNLLRSNLLNYKKSKEKEYQILP